jgi:hypothetical protein
MYYRVYYSGNREAVDKIIKLKKRKCNKIFKSKVYL